MNPPIPEPPGLTDLRFESPELLGLVVLWLLVLAWIGHRHHGALRWIGDRVAPRFQRRLSRHSHGTLNAHLVGLAVLGLLLTLAATGPWIPGPEEQTVEGADILLLLDGSASMAATDLGADPANEGRELTRFELARRLAADLVAALPESRFGVLTFSGVATTQLPRTADRSAIDETLRVVEVHTHYRNSGSSFTAALDAILPFAADPARRRSLHIVLLSDGEQPRPEAFDGPLTALAELDVPVHGLAIGTTTGQGRVIYDFRDVFAKKEEKRILVEFTTRREDVHLRQMARATGGSFAAIDDAEIADAVADLATVIREHPAALPELDAWQALEAGQPLTGRRHFAAFALALFLVGFWIESLVVGRRPPPEPRFEIDRLGDPPTSAGRTLGGVALVVTLLTLFACRGDDRVTRAHQENETGITLDALGQHADAGRRYERSRAFGIRPHVPTYNLARSHTLREDHASAHALYEAALELDPELAEAYYNDGVTLFRWGVEERDPRGCELDRTLDLWQRALDRFVEVSDHDPSDALAEQAERNHDALRDAIAEIEALIAEPPPECRASSQSPPPPSGDDSGEGGDGGEGGEGDDDNAGGGGAAGAGGSPPPPSPPPPPPPTTPDAETIAEALARIAQSRLEAGKYHRRTLPEQFPRSSWENPSEEIWW